MTIDPIVVQDNMIGWRRQHTGTHSTDYMGFPASGEQVKWSTIVLTRMKDGKIAQEWGQGNLYQVLQRKTQEKL